MYEDQECPDCGGDLERRTNGRTGGLFLACVNYPECEYTKSMYEEKKYYDKWNDEDENYFFLSNNE